MSEELKNIKVPDSNDLSFERTMLSHERTLMSWVRTSVSLISFGFTMYKFFDELKSTANEGNDLFTPRIAGMIMIGFGQVALILALIQHRIAVKRIRSFHPGLQRSLSSVIAFLVLVFGLILFLAAVFRQ